MRGFNNSNWEVEIISFYLFYYNSRSELINQNRVNKSNISNKYMWQIFDYFKTVTLLILKRL